jgi:hypothetical protein
VRQLAAAFETSPVCLLFKGLPESGSKLPQSESFALQKVCGIGRDGGAPSG